MMEQRRYRRPMHVVLESSETRRVRSPGSSATDAEGESGCIPVLEPSRVEQTPKKPSKTAQQMRRQRKFQTKSDRKEGSAEGLQQIQRPSVHAPQQAERELLHFQQCFLTYCQHDPSWIVKAIPKAMLTAVFKAKSATRCWRFPHLRAMGKCRPSIKHKTKMHYHFECIMGEQPWEKRKFSDRRR